MSEISSPYTDIISDGAFDAHQDVHDIKDEENERHTNHCDTCSLLCGPFLWLGGLLLCIKITRNQRLATMWFWVLLIVISVLVYIYVIQFPNNQFAASPGDSRVITKRFQSIFCRSIGIQSTNGSPFQVFLLNEEPNPIILHQNLTVERTISSTSFQMWRLYFLQHSMIVMRLEVCTNFPLLGNHTEIEFYIIKGKINWYKWKRDKSCERCILTKWKITVNETCGLVKRTHKEHPRIADNDEYYYVMLNTHAKHYIEMKINFEMHRYVYDVEHNSIEQCSEEGVGVCRINMTAFSMQIGVYVAPYNTDFNIGMDIHCTPQVSTFCVLSCIPLAICCIVTVIAVMYHKNEQKHHSIQTHTQTRQLKGRDEKVRFLPPSEGQPCFEYVTQEVSSLVSALYINQ